MTALATRPAHYNASANLHSALTNRSAGDSTQAMLQALGMDRSQAAFYGALKDLQGGNLVGFHQNLTEALTGFESRGGALGAKLRRQHAFRHLHHHHCARSHHVCRPAHAHSARLQRIDLANQAGGLPGALGAFAGFATGGLLGGGLGALLGKTVARAKAKCIESRLRRDPCFRRAFEAKVGGRYIPDGRNDGKITILRPGFRPFLPGLAPGAFSGCIGRPGCGSVLSGLTKAMQNIGNLLGGLNQGAAQPGFSAQGAGNSNSLQQSAKPGSEVSKLGPNPSFEDLVSAFMMDMVKDMQDELKAKMGEYEKMKGGDKGQGAQGAGQSSSSNGGGGFLGGILGGLGKVAGLGGSILGGIFGGPVGSMIGGGLGNALGGLLGQAGGAASGQSAGAQSAQGKGGAQGAKGDEDSRQLLFEKIKDLMQKMQQALQSLSNVINTMHQGSMNAIRNIKA